MKAVAGAAFEQRDQEEGIFEGTEYDSICPQDEATEGKQEGGEWYR